MHSSYLFHYFPLLPFVAFFIASLSDRFKLQIYGQIKVTKNRNKFALGAGSDRGRKLVGLTDGRRGEAESGTGRMVDCWFDQAVIEML